MKFVWEEMDRKIKANKTTSLTGLEDITREVCREIKHEVLTNLLDQFPRDCKAVICIKIIGGHFDEKYARQKFKNQEVY